MKSFDKTIYVKREQDRDTSYLVSTGDPSELVAVGEKIVVGVYELVGTEEIEGTVTRRVVSKTRRPYSKE